MVGQEFSTTGLESSKITTGSGNVTNVQLVGELDVRDREVIKRVVGVVVNRILEPILHNTSVTPQGRSVVETYRGVEYRPVKWIFPLAISFSARIVPREQNISVGSE